MVKASDRIRLLPVAIEDAEALQQILADEDIYKNTLSIPSPLPENWAYDWIKILQQANAQDKSVSFAIKSQTDDKVMGIISLLDINAEHERAELAYLIGRQFRRQGYAGEAVKLLIDYGFNQLNLSRLYAYHFDHNQGSGALLRKLGFQHEGCLRGHIKKDGQFIHSEVYGLLKHSQ